MAEFPDWETPEDALDYSAVKLFMQSAQRVNYSFELKAQDLRYVARICRLVEGMPLGVLLAASWVDMLTPEEIANEIARNVDFLESSTRHLPERQRSMQGVFDHSWRLLDSDEQDVFAKLSVFQGGFTREAAQDVTGASLRNLQTLVHKSFLQRDASTGRYAIHELMRQFGARILTELDESDSTLDRHSSYYLQLLSNMVHNLYGPVEDETQEVLSVEYDNIQKAWYRVLHNENIDAILNTYRTIADTLSRINRFEDLMRLKENTLDILNNQPDTPETLALSALIKVQRAYQSYLSGSTTLDMYEEIIVDNKSTIEENGSIWQQAYLHTHIGYWGEHTGQFEIGQLHHEKGLALSREIDDIIGQIHALDELAWTCYRSEKFDQANAYITEGVNLGKGINSRYLLKWSKRRAIAIMRDRKEQLPAYKALLQENKVTEDEYFIARTLKNFGWTQYLEGDYQGAKRSTLKAMKLQSMFGLQSKPINLGWIEEALGNRDLAKRYTVQSIHDAFETWDQFHAVELLLLIATLLEADGDNERAVQFMGMCSTVETTDPSCREISAKLYGKLRAEVDPETFHVAYEHGKTLDMKTELLKILEEWDG